MLLKREILALRQDIARQCERTRTFEMETHELRQRLVASEKANKELREDMDGYKEGLRKHFEGLETEYHEMKVRVCCFLFGFALRCVGSVSQWFVASTLPRSSPLTVAVGLKLSPWLSLRLSSSSFGMNTKI